MTAARRFVLLAAVLCASAPASAMSIRELAQYDQKALVAHITGSLDGLSAGFRASGNIKALECVHRWAAPVAGGDSQALTDILTRYADAMVALKQRGGRVIQYEELLASTLRTQCGDVLPSAQ